MIKGFFTNCTQHQAWDSKWFDILKGHVGTIEDVTLKGEFADANVTNMASKLTIVLQKYFETLPNNGLALFLCDRTSILVAMMRKATLHL